MSEEGQLSFKVSDRRLFNPDGTLRANIELREAEGAASPETKGTADEPTAMSSQKAAPHAERAPEPKEDPLFSDFVLELATNAMVMLGLIEHPQYGRLAPDIEGARHYIDILGMLVEKTKGNLTPSEERQLQDTVSSLRMQFVAVTKRMATQVRTKET
jgi:hypothetical protein